MRMSRGLVPWLAALLVTAVVLSTAASGASHRSYWTICNTSLPSTLKVHRVGCATGHRVIGRFSIKAQTHGPHTRVDGFDCRAKGNGTIRCRRGGKRIHYAGGF
jgi:hypothetical protein